MKKTQKSLDKVSKVWYYIKAVPKRGQWGEAKAWSWSLKIEQQRKTNEIQKYRVWILVNKQNLNKKFSEFIYSTQKVIKAKDKSAMIIICQDIFILWRVWSWLRMNAGGVHNTFKSNGQGGACSSELVADGWVTREQPAFGSGITQGNLC